MQQPWGPPDIGFDALKNDVFSMAHDTQRKDWTPRADRWSPSSSSSSSPFKMLQGDRSFRAHEVWALLHLALALGADHRHGVKPWSPTTTIFAHRASVGHSKSPPTFPVKPRGRCRDRGILVSVASTSGPARHSPLLRPWPWLLSLPPLPAWSGRASSPLAQISPGFPH